MKHNLNPKVIATGLFNVAEQINALDRVKDSLNSLNPVSYTHLTLPTKLEV